MIIIRKHLKPKFMLWVVFAVALWLAEQNGWLTQPSSNALDSNLSNQNQFIEEAGTDAFVQDSAAKNIPMGFYEVVEFYDGDTIAVNMNGLHQKIRLIGVDTPETHDPRKPVQCFGQAAADFTAKLIGSEAVRLEADPLSTNRDRYARLLRYVYLPDERLVNAEIIKEGYGFAYLSFPFEKSDEFKEYEDQAKQAGKGLWSSCRPKVDVKGYIGSGAAN